MDNSIIIAILAALGSIGTLLTVRSQNRKVKNEAINILTGTALDLVGPQREENALNRTEIRRLTDGVVLLTTQLREAGLEPVWSLYDE